MRGERVPRIVVLSSFGAELEWLGRRTAVRDLRAGIPEALVRRSRFVVSDVEALAPRLAADVRGDPLRERPVLLLDSVGPANLTADFVRALRERANVFVGYGVGTHRAGYLRRGLPSRRLVHLRPSTAFFPIMFRDYREPARTWKPPARTRLFCGGRVWRDWGTLKEASTVLGRPIEVVTDLGRVRLGEPGGLVARDRLPFGGFCRALVRSSVAVIPVLPRRNAGQATLVLAMHLGVPPVATATAATRECARHGRDALLVRPGDPRALAAAVSRLLDRPDEAAALGRRARETERRLARETEAALDRLLRRVGA
ncbi:MAG: glycosyltransferase [Deltaproteobacteria bacterium]|nr:glycosyltransferase [Deltaproteobacteria bacterium]